MKLFIITTVFALSSAALLPSRNYIPQSQGSQTGHQGDAGSALGDKGNRRPQQEAERNAAILKQQQEANENGNYFFGFETSNGIRAEESGNPANTQGGYAYKGDDGNTYTVTYIAGEGGFRPQGEHLPVPPTPEDILEALRKNEQDEAAGIFDDGKYHPEQHGGGNKPGFGSSGQRGSSNQQGSSSGYQY